MKFLLIHWVYFLVFLSDWNLRHRQLFLDRGAAVLWTEVQSVFCAGLYTGGSDCPSLMAGLLYPKECYPCKSLHRYVNTPSVLSFCAIFLFCAKFINYESWINHEKMKIIINLPLKWCVFFTQCLPTAFTMFVHVSEREFFSSNCSTYAVECDWNNNISQNERNLFFVSKN